jgi:hypothetical protein
LTLGYQRGIEFTFLGLSIHGAFKGIEFEDDRSLASEVFYFATLTTTGYGDIVPVHPWARSHCNLQAIAQRSWQGL